MKYSLKKNLSFASLFVLACLTYSPASQAMYMDPEADQREAQQETEDTNHRQEGEKKRKHENGQDAEEPAAKRHRGNDENLDEIPPSFAASESTETFVLPSSSSASAALTTQNTAQNTDLRATILQKITKEQIKQLIADAKNHNVEAQDKLMELHYLSQQDSVSSRKWCDLIDELQIDIFNWQGGSPLKERFLSNSYYLYFLCKYAIPEKEMASKWQLDTHEGRLAFFEELKKKPCQGNAGLDLFNKGLFLEQFLNEREQGLKYCTLAAEQGFGEADAEIADNYYTSEDSANAWKHYQLALTKGFRFGNLDKHTFKITNIVKSETDPAKKEGMLSFALNHCPLIYYILGVSYHNEDQNEEALPYYMKVIETITSPEHSVIVKWCKKAARFILKETGLKYYNADSPNFKKAAKSFQQAADFGDNSAYSMLAQMYFDGKGVTRNYEKAKSYLNKTSLDTSDSWFDCRPDEHWPGIFYVEGFLYEMRDPITTISLYRQAIALGFIPAEERLDAYLKKLASAYNNGRINLRLSPKFAGNNANTYVAIDLIRDAIYGLESRTLKTGNLSTFANDKRDILFLHRLADKGWDKAQYELGLRYEQGAGVEPDIQKALKYYAFASDQGNIDASYAAARVYGDLESDICDFQEAERYEKRAAKQGDINLSRKFCEQYLSCNNPIKAEKYWQLLQQHMPADSFPIIVPGSIGPLPFVISAQKRIDNLFNEYKTLAEKNDRKALFTLGSMRFYASDFQSKEDSKKHLELAIKSEEEDAQKGRAYHKLARLLMNMDASKAIEYVNEAIQKGHIGALKTRADLYKKWDEDRPMTAGYVYQNVCKGLSHHSALNPYFIFEKSHRDSVTNTEDPFDFLAFMAKTKVLSHDLLFTQEIHSSGKGALFDMKGKLGISELDTLYYNLITFGEKLEAFVSHFIEAEKASPLPGFLITRVKPTDHLRETYSDELEGAQKGFCLIKIDNEEFACVGGHNPEKGFHFKRLIEEERTTAQDTVVKISDILEKRLVTLKKELENKALPDEYRKHIEGQHTQLTGELKKLPALSQAILDMPNELKKLVKSRVHLRNQAFEDKHPELFGD